MDGKGGKIRFDLKQISAWDKQNENELKKKAEPKSSKGRPFKFDPSQQEGDGTGFDHGYRDRALERRKETSTEDSKMEEIVSKLDAEQTKFLGGDMEHTHLVKGLDYALLEKVRKQKEKEDLQNIVAVQQAAEVQDYHQVEPSSQLGETMLRFFSRQQRENLATGAAAVVATKGASTAGAMLQRTVFDFDTRPESDVDIPLLVTRSRKEFTTNDEYVNFMLDSDIMAALAQLLESGKLLTAKQKKKKLLKESSAACSGVSGAGGDNTDSVNTGAQSAAAAGPPKLLPTDFDSMYDDDVVVGKYVPEGSLEEGEIANPTTASAGSAIKPIFGDDIYGGLLPPNSGSKGVSGSVFSAAAAFGAGAHATTAASNVPSARDIFNNLPPTIHSSSGNQGTSSHAGLNKANTAQPSTSNSSNASASAKAQDDLMKPIRDLLGAQAAKERAAKERLLAQAVPKSREMVVEKDEKGQLLVHRDVFLTTRDKVVNAGEDKGKKKDKAGEVFGLQGHYDLFPETTGSYEQFDSDEEGAEDKGAAGEPAAKKSKIEGSVGGKTSEWDRPARHSSADSSSANHGTSGGFSKTIAGLEGSIKKSIATPWARHGGGGSSSSGGGSGGGGGSAGGVNRAARRAAGPK